MNNETLTNRLFDAMILCGGQFGETAQALRSDRLATPKQINVLLNRRTGATSTYRIIINSILNDEPPAASSIREQSIAMTRKMLRNPATPEPVEEYLRRHLSALESVDPAEPVTAPPLERPLLSPVVRDELTGFLADDATQLGEVWRAMDADPTITSTGIAATTGVANAGAASHHRNLARTLLGDPPLSASVAARTAAKIGTMLRSGVWSVEARAYLSDLRTVLEPGDTFDDDIDRAREEGDRAAAAADTDPTTTGGCVYAFTLPHYLRHPVMVDPDERTLIKVGYTGGDARRRITDQVRATGQPEDPVVLRIWRGRDGTDMAVVERTIHRVLLAFGHNRQDGRTTGREWFITSLGALDALADVLGLLTEYRNEV